MIALGFAYPIRRGLAAGLLVLASITGLAHPLLAADLAVQSTDATLGETPQIQLSLSLQLRDGESLSAMQLDLCFDARQLVFTGVDQGPAVGQTGKQISYALLSPDRVRILAYGINQISLASGVIAFPSFRLASQAGAGTTPVKIENLVACSAQTTLVPVTSQDGCVTISVPGTVSGLAASRAYPNPFRPYTGQVRIFFAPLTTEARIRIFKLSGELLAEIRNSGGGLAVWDGKNAGGHDLASGVYFYVITNPAGEKKSGKIVIIR
jgi:hypothetical protein